MDQFSGREVSSSSGVGDPTADAVESYADAAGSAGWSERRKPRLFAVYLLFVAAYSIRTGLEQARSQDSWVIGDWLINYSGGFVRRGLTGEVALLLHRVSGVPLEWVIFLFQASVFLIFLGCVYRLTKGIRWSYWMVVVLLSPATLAFTVLDQIGFRKEFLLLAALGLTIWALISGRWKDWQMSAMLSVPFATVSDESNESCVLGTTANALVARSIACTVPLTCALPTRCSR